MLSVFLPKDRYFLILAFESLRENRNSSLKDEQRQGSQFFQVYSGKIQENNGKISTSISGKFRKLDAKAKEWFTQIKKRVHHDLHLSSR